MPEFDGHEAEVKIDGEFALRLNKDGAVEGRANPEWDLRYVYDALCNLKRREPVKEDQETVHLECVSGVSAPCLDCDEKLRRRGVRKKVKYEPTDAEKAMSIREAEATKGLESDEEFGLKDIKESGDANVHPYGCQCEGCKQAAKHLEELYAAKKEALVGEVVDRVMDNFEVKKADEGDLEPRFGESDPHVDHPEHYGGADDPYEAIKVIERIGLGYGFCVGNALKYIKRAGKKGDREDLLTDLKKARWYTNRAAQNGPGAVDRIEPAPTIEAWGVAVSSLGAAVYALMRGEPEDAVRQLDDAIEASEKHLR